MIEKYIKYLLFEHDCVVIPEFGGFIANYVSADIHPIHHTFQPPSKNIAFNEMLKLNDGLLISHISASEKISREEAQKLVKEYTEFVKNEIRSKDKYKFEEIGTLYLNHEQRLQFEPENKINYLSHSFGLPELDYKPIERASSYTKFKTKDRPAMMNPDALDEEEDQLVFPVEKKSSRSRLLLAIVIPVLLLLAGSAGYFLFLDNGNTALSSFDPFTALKSSRNEEDTTMVVDDSFLYADTTLQASVDTNSLASAADDWSTAPAAESETSSFTETAPVTEELQKTNEVVAAPTEEKPAVTSFTETAPENTDGVAVVGNPRRYYVIIGGFSVRENAFKLKEELNSKGNSDAKVVVPKTDGNLLKVSYADFDTFATAASKAEELKAIYGSSVWVLKY
ncbi:hypothetical protein GXP67_08550 [Rhodocytophaga rosea]|uniref:SPOR domain-containing protein n=1 Tax=Rhodocytophaga rosea TaxID=2704465 RepID=A0A6C0GFV4_9BACT|nr:SPOR domain-containing protein [Rhodocytophaga rosea]QHT66704.1 hypothetical protein GXP67_08550 [Rhodocytophaga rosea]